MEISSEELFNLQILAERAVKEKIEKMKGRGTESYLVMFSLTRNHFCGMFEIIAVESNLNFT